eukprot:1899616-Lingulodinium_polyedra.AAC.1
MTCASHRPPAQPSARAWRTRPHVRPTTRAERLRAQPEGSAATSGRLVGPAHDGRAGRAPQGPA